MCAYCHHTQYFLNVCKRRVCWYDCWEAECLLTIIFFFLKKSGAGLFYNPHTHKTTNLTRSLATNHIFIFVVLHEILVTWLRAVDLTGLAEYSVLQPDSLRCNQRKEKLPATSVERVSCNHRKSLACLCEWNLKRKYQYYKQSQPYQSFFYIDIFFVKQVWITYQSINQSILHMKSGFYCIIACAKLQSQLVWMCVCVSEQHERGLCSSVYPVWPASVRFLGDSSHAFAHRPVNILVRVFHRFFSGYKGSGLLYVHDVSTWRRVGMKLEVRVIIPKCVWGNIFLLYSAKTWRICFLDWR